MDKSNKEIARSIAEIVYDIQSEGDFFYEHLRYEYGIIDKFAEKILADEDRKEVMICQMSADILSDIIEDPKGFHVKHSSEDFDDGIGYHPDDLEYDHRMTEYITQVYSDPTVRTKVMGEVHVEMPIKTFRMHAKFESHSYIDIKAKTQDEAYEIARDMDGGDFISNEERDGSWEVYECEDMEAE